jgi:hypothetical protein
MKKFQWTWSIVFLVVLVSFSIIGVVIWGVMRSQDIESVPSPTTTPLNLSITSRNVGVGPISSADYSLRNTSLKDCGEAFEISKCRLPSTQETSDNGWKKDYRVCKFKTPVWKCVSDIRDWDLVGNTFQRVGENVFSPKGVGDIVVDMENISGSFHNLVMVFDDVLWSEGFSGGDMKNLSSKTLEKLKSSYKSSSTHVLVGDAKDPLPSNCKPKFNFDIKYPVYIPMNALPTDVVVPTLSGKRLNGVLRMSTDHLDYSFKLDSKECKIRVLLGRCDTNKNSVVGVKQVYSHGDYWFLDNDTGQLTLSNPGKALSFWNQKGGKHTDEDKSLVQNLFSKSRMGIPIEVVNETLNFNKFKHSNVTMDIFSSGRIGFRGALDDGFTEKSLSEDPQELLKRFDIDDLQLKALFSFD